MLLLGPSGSGKSTLLQVLSGIIPRLVEVPMRCASQRLPRSWGYVFQDPDTQFCMPFVDEELAFTLENLGGSPAGNDRPDGGGAGGRRAAFARAAHADPGPVARDEAAARFGFGAARRSGGFAARRAFRAA
ncbi:ATP-binding cassette domain-containing protein [Paenibacillus macerans]